ncbi:hypothetical protein LTR65_006140 [Meristemomyces frigidus]
MADVDTSDWIPGTRFFTQVTEQNHAGWLYIVTLMSLCYVIVVIAVRFVVKYGMYGRDDWALLVATIFAVGQHIAVLAGLAGGMGKSITLLSHSQVGGIQKFTAAHGFLFIIAHSISKLSTALLTQRLFENGRRRNIYLCWGMVGAAPDQCSNRFLRWQLITAIDIVTEVFLVVIPCLLLVDVQIKRSAKLLVMAVFAVRLPDVVFSALNLHSMRVSYLHQDVGLALVYPLIWTQTELLWSIVAASVPCLKTFMRPFDKIDEDTWHSNNDLYASQRSGRSWRDPRDKDGAVPLEEVRGHKRGLIISASGNDMGAVRPDQVGHAVVIAHTGVDSASEEDHRRSWGSQDRIIKAETQWEVRTEHNPRDPYSFPVTSDKAGEETGATSEKDPRAKRDKATAGRFHAGRETAALSQRVPEAVKDLYMDMIGWSPDELAS